MISPGRHQGFRYHVTTALQHHTQHTMSTQRSHTAHAKAERNSVLESCKPERCSALLASFSSQQACGGQSGHGLGCLGCGGSASFATRLRFPQTKRIRIRMETWKTRQNMMSTSLHSVEHQHTADGLKLACCSSLHRTSHRVACLQGTATPTSGPGWARPM